MGDKEDPTKLLVLVIWKDATSADTHIPALVTRWTVGFFAQYDKEQRCISIAREYHEKHGYCYNITIPITQIQDIEDLTIKGNEDILTRTKDISKDISRGQTSTNRTF